MTELARIEPQQTAVAAPAENVSPMIAMIERVALDPNASIEKLERMLDMRDRLQAESARAAFSAAFAAASAEFPSIPLNGRGDKNKPYALLKDIVNLTRPVLARHGLALSFGVESHSDRVVVTAELMHVSGHSKTTSIELPRDTSGSKNAVQSVGSSQTYGQRYTAQAILGLSLGDDTDDDGASAGGKATITAEEYFQLRNLLDEAEADEARFCQFLKVQHLEELPSRMFANAVSALRKKIAAKKAGA